VAKQTARRVVGSLERWVLRLELERRLEEAVVIILLYRC
jgi:hypothetical protein